MFCVLSVKERNRTLFERLFRKFLVDEYSVKTVPVFKGAPFFMLDITTGKREIDWDNVVFAVGKLCLFCPFGSGDGVLHVGECELCGLLKSLAMEDL